MNILIFHAFEQRIFFCQIENVAQPGKCLDRLGVNLYKPIGVYNCDIRSRNQIFMVTNDHKLNHQSNCLETKGSNDPVRVTICVDLVEQKFEYDKEVFFFNKHFSTVTGETQTYAKFLVFNFRPKSSGMEMGQIA